MRDKLRSLWVAEAPNLNINGVAQGTNASASIISSQKNNFLSCANTNYGAGLTGVKKTPPILSKGAGGYSLSK